MKKNFFPSFRRNNLWYFLFFSREDYYPFDIVSSPRNNSFLDAINDNERAEIPL